MRSLALSGYEMFVGWLVSDDGTAATIMAKVEDVHEHQIQAYREAKEKTKH